MGYEESRLRQILRDEEFTLFKLDDLLRDDFGVERSIFRSIDTTLRKNHFDVTLGNGSVMSIEFQVIHPCMGPLFYKTTIKVIAVRSKR